MYGVENEQECFAYAQQELMAVFFFFVVFFFFEIQEKNPVAKG